GRLAPLEHELLRNLGPEPLTDAFAGQRLFELSRGRSMAVKPFIMDNAVVVGVGNIYASEALFAAGIDPRKPAGSSSKARYLRLAEEIKRILAIAIERGGTTLR
ncbi:DNA-formamidopyrimidine glycosylase, partial [Listeria monocytogenes]|nr:DNA-formamidopyrimidine glycosylase [Listeria monocytogenes]